MFKVTTRLLPISLLLLVISASACYQKGRPVEPKALTSNGPDANKAKTETETEGTPSSTGKVSGDSITAGSSDGQDNEGESKGKGSDADGVGKAQTPSTSSSGTGSDKASDALPSGPLASGVYTIKGTGSNKCLQPGVEAGGMLPALVQFACSGASNQRFLINYVNGTFYSLTNVASGKAIELKDQVPIKEGRIQLNTYHGSANQQFTFVKLSDGRFNIKPLLNAALCFDVSFASRDDNVFIQLWHECNLVNESWIITPAS